MTAVPSLDPDNDIWHWIAVELRFWRERSGLPLSSMAKIMRTTKAVVSNIEHARRSHRMNADHAAALDRHYNLGEHFQRLVRYARAGHHPDWFREHVRYETRAEIIQFCSLAIIPGLLQTPDYARAILEGGQIVKDVEAALSARIARQGILDRTEPPSVRVLISQMALEFPIGGSDVMRGQLERLLELSDRPAVSIRVAPRAEGFHLGLEGPFVLTTAPEGRVAYLESCGGGRLEEAPQEVGKFELRWSRVNDVALPARASRNLMTEIMEGF